MKNTQQGQTNHFAMCEEARRDLQVARGQYQGACDIVRELERKLVEEQRCRKFKRLSDAQWVNVVNHPDVLKDGNYDAEDAVAMAFKLIEGKLEEINTPEGCAEEFAKAVDRARAEQREEDAKKLEMTTQELLLMAGEMTREELLTVQAVLSNRARVIRKGI